MFNRRATAGRQGYGHMAHQQPPFQQHSIDKENQPINNNENKLTDALALFTIAANADRTAFATITTTSNQQLTNQLTNAMKRLADLEKKLNKNRGGRDPGDNSTHYTLPNNKNYCHMHGYVVANKHTSATCNGKADAHKDTATRADTMG
jgi:hypothetical protein